MAFITIRAMPGNLSKKGEVVRVSDTNWFTGGEALPRCLRIEVTGATTADVEHFLGRLNSAVSYTIVNENAARWRVRMKLDSAIVLATGMNNNFKQHIKDFILTNHEGDWTAAQVSQNSAQLTVDIAKGQAFDLTQIKQEVNDEFTDKVEKVLHFQRYFFPDSIVDPRVIQGLIDEAAVANGEGLIPRDFIHSTITKAQALANISDRLSS